VIWRGRHVVEPYDLTEDEAGAYWNDVLTVARALARHYQPLKMNYQTLGNTVPHLHTHLLPRFVDDPAPGRPFPLLPQDGTEASVDPHSLAADATLVQGGALRAPQGSAPNAAASARAERAACRPTPRGARLPWTSLHTQPRNAHGRRTAGTSTGQINSGRSRTVPTSKGLEQQPITTTRDSRRYLRNPLSGIRVRGVSRP
jgi:hypothetical protein